MQINTNEHINFIICLLSFWTTSQVAKLIHWILEPLKSDADVGS